MDDIRPVGISDILASRDARAERQRAFLQRHHVPLISFTMNIAGSIKRDALIERAFSEGVRRINAQLERRGWSVLAAVKTTAFTGCEALWAVQVEAEELKRVMCLAEDSDALGRLFDIDVIRSDGSFLSRETERECLICGKPVRACARSRTHSQTELYEKTHAIISAHFRQTYIRKIGEMAQRALLYEVAVAPKPGLVDTENCGSHADMDFFSFLRSACVLRPYFEHCAALGARHASPKQLQYEGVMAETDMFTAVQANTHKGAVFALGILCWAAGCCGEEGDLLVVTEKAAELGKVYLRENQDRMAPLTGGDFREYGFSGARGEAASGFRMAREIGLPALEEALAMRKDLNTAGLYALMNLIANVRDSNILRRAGMEGQKWAAAQAQQWLDEGATPEALRAMNVRFMEKNISPGGSADLLAVTYWLFFMKTERENNE